MAQNINELAALLAQGSQAQGQLQGLEEQRAKSAALRDTPYQNFDNPNPIAAVLNAMRRDRGRKDIEAGASELQNVRGQVAASQNALPLYKAHRAKEAADLAQSNVMYNRDYLEGRDDVADENTLKAQTRQTEQDDLKQSNLTTSLTLDATHRDENLALEAQIRQEKRELEQRDWATEQDRLNAIRNKQALDESRRQELQVKQQEETERRNKATETAAADKATALAASQEATLNKPSFEMYVDDKGKSFEVLHVGDQTLTRDEEGELIPVDLSGAMKASEKHKQTIALSKAAAKAEKDRLKKLEDAKNTRYAEVALPGDPEGGYEYQTSEYQIGKGIEKLGKRVKDIQQITNNIEEVDAILRPFTKGGEKENVDPNGWGFWLSTQNAVGDLTRWGADLVNPEGKAQETWAKIAKLLSSEIKEATGLTQTAQEMKRTLTAMGLSFGTDKKVFMKQFAAYKRLAAKRVEEVLKTSPRDVQRRYRDNNGSLVDWSSTPLDWRNHGVYQEGPAAAVDDPAPTALKPVSEMTREEKIKELGL